MSEAASASVGMGGYGGFRPPFTAVQWQELEHQAMIYKYLVAGVPVPPDLVLPIRRSLEAISARFFPYPSLGYCSYYGKKFDPEPGRCRRTDGKKWRCSKDAHPDSKYCERHMHRGRNRSRKPVESQSSSPSLSSTSMSQISSGRGSTAGSFQNMPLYGAVCSEGSSFGSNATKLQMDPLPYAIDNKEIRYSHGRTADTIGHSFSTEASGSIGNLGTSSADAWRLMPSQLQQHCFLGSEIALSDSVKQEQHAVHPFFSEWPSTKEPWSSLNSDDGSNMNLFSSTQLSISIPRPSSSFSPRSAYSPTDA